MAGRAGLGGIPIDARARRMRGGRAPAHPRMVRKSVQKKKAERLCSDLPFNAVRTAIQPAFHNGRQTLAGAAPIARQLTALR